MKINLVSLLLVGLLGCSSENSDNPVISPPPVGNQLFQLDPAGEWQFGTLAVGQSATKDVRLKNTGSVPLLIANISSPALPFSIERSACTTFELDPGDSCIVKVVAHPTQKGLFESSFTIYSAGSNVDFKLSCIARDL